MVSTPSLPTVQWGPHHITRLIVGHNPLKGHSHHTKALDAEMAEWFKATPQHGLDHLRRCQEVGINTAQFGGPGMLSLLREFHRQGGAMQWIATFYNKGGDKQKELDAILAMEPRPLGIQYFGERIDEMFIEKRMHQAKDWFKKIRDGGVMAGVCTHMPEVVDYVESAGWEIDFYQTCFHTVYSHSDAGAIDRGSEKFLDADRDRMTAAIRRTSKPCIAFKILAANRKCGDDQSLTAAFRYAFDNIKPTDVVAVGMWQKHKDQIGQNAAIVESLLAR